MRVPRITFALACVTVAIAPTQATAQVREQRLTQPDATFPQEFGLIRGVRELPDGRVLVADGAGQVVVLLDLASGTADTVGREGQGPREYRQPDGVFPMPGDSTLLVDLGNGRLTMLGPTMAFGRTEPISLGEPRPGALSIRLPQGTDARGRLYYQAAGRTAADGSLLDSAGVLRWDAVASREDTVAKVKLEETSVSRSGGPNNQSVSMRPKPLTGRDGWAVGPDGRIGVVRLVDYHVEWIEPDGRVVRGPAVPYQPVRVGSAEKEAYFEQLGRSGLMIGVTNENGQIRTQMRRGGGRPPGMNANDLEWPEVMPPFQPSGVFAAPSGELWVERAMPANAPVTYDVFDRSARLVKQVILPEGRRLLGFGSGVVYAVRVDDLDLNYLERYRVAP